MTQLNAGKTTVLALSTMLVLSAFLLLNSLSIASAKDSREDEEKVNVCHQTSSEGNPWVVQEIKANELQSHIDNGDFLYNGPVKDNGKPDNKDKQADQWCEDHSDDNETEKTPVCTNDSYDNYGGADGRFDPETEVSNNELCANDPVTPSDPIPTPFVTPVCTGDTHLDAAGKNCVSFEYNGAPASNGSNGQVLGASTMAGTGSFEESLYQGIMTLGATLSAFGIKGLKKAKKVSKK